MHLRTESNINRTTPNGKIFYFLLLAVYRLALDYAYGHVISVEYKYMGFSKDVTYYNYILSWGLLFIVALLNYNCYYNKSRKLSLQILFWLFIISFLPFTSLVAFGMFSYGFVFTNFVYWVALFFFVNIFSSVKSGKKEFKIGNIPLLQEKQIQIIALISFGIVLFISWRYTHFRINFNLMNVYDLRNEAATYKLPILIDYMFSWSRMINSVLIAYFIRKHKWIWATFSFLVQMLNFGIDVSKTTFFLAIFAIIISLLPQKLLNDINSETLVVFPLIICICIIAFDVFGNIMPISLFVRRVLYVPSYIQSMYFDFFANNTPDYFRLSFLRYFGAKSSYSNIPYMIAKLYFNANMSANNGLISDAMANLGFLGIIIMPAFIAFVFRLLDSSSAGLDQRVYLTVALYVSIEMTNTFIFTLLMTHGLLVTMIVLKMMKRDNESSLGVLELSE